MAARNVTATHAKPRLAPVYASHVDFEWDEEKERLNRSKHRGVRFEEAATCFFDDLARSRPDPDHSDSEERFVLIGQSTTRSRLLVVSYTERGQTVRIISARRPTARERKSYEEHD